MKKFILTFTRSQSLKDNYIVVEAKNYAEATEKVKSVYGKAYANLYDLEKDLDNQIEAYMGTEVLFGRNVQSPEYYSN